MVTIPYKIVFLTIFSSFQILQSKFDDLKHRVEVNADRFNQCEEFATKLITSETTYAADIEKRQDQLRLVTTFFV